MTNIPQSYNFAIITAMMSHGDHHFNLFVFSTYLGHFPLCEGGGGEAEAALPDVQLGRLAGPDVLRQLYHTHRLPAMASTSIKSKQETGSVFYCV